MNFNIYRSFAMRLFRFPSGIQILAASMGLAFGCCKMALAQQAALPEYMTQRDGGTDPQAISSNETMWAAFQFFSGWEAQTPGLGATVLQDAGLSQADALALIKHIHSSIADVNAHSNELSHNLCANTKPLAGVQTSTAGRSMLAHSFQAIDVSMDDQRAAHIGEIYSVISPASKAALIAWTNKNILPHLKITSVDYAKRFTLEDSDPDTEIARFCSKVNTGSTASSVPKAVTGPGGVTAVAQ
jgi:hypothetical protein